MTAAPKLATDQDFIPATRAVSIGHGIVYRPIRSWHSGVLAGERYDPKPREDRSGCIVGQLRGLDVTQPPRTVTHRIYWSPDRPKRWISAFLSYPNGMSCVDHYHWEVLIDGEVERFSTEEECEAAIVAALNGGVARDE